MTAGDHATASPWRPLYLSGSIAAFLAVFVFRRFLSAELVAFNGFGIFSIPQPLPSRAVEWFGLLQAQPLLGLALLDVFDLVEYALLGLVFLALGAALWQTSRSLTLVAAACGLGGIVLCFAASQAFAILALSRNFAAAQSEAQRSLFAAAGEALLAEHNPAGTFGGLFFVLLAGLLFSIAMWRSPKFNKAAAGSGILANGSGLAYFVLLPLAPGLIALPFVISAPFRMIWYLLIAWKLFQAARGKQ